MFAKWSKMLALKSADRVLESRSKIANVIEREERKLLDLIAERVKADRALVTAETAAALGELTDLPAARKHVEDVHAAIGRQASTLGGLRSRLAAQSPELEAQVRAIQAALPEHVQALKDNFAGEWSKGIAAFGALLGKRSAIESLLRATLDLPAPQPIPCELESEAAPWRGIEALRSGLEQIAGWSRAAIWPAVDAMGQRGSRAFDPQAVYVLLRDYDSLPAGTFVMEACLPPGMLAHLVQIEYAASLSSQAWRDGLEGGAHAARVLEFESASEDARAALEQQETHLKGQAKNVPIHLQRPNPEDDPEYKRQREAAEHRGQQSVLNPETVGRMEI
jgi:hypothetical protein